jgi:nitrogen PTS system EIIA component
VAVDLKIKDVADLLNISETTVRRWLSDGKIPAYRLNRQYRFSLAEIEDWLMQQKLSVAFEDGKKQTPPKEELPTKLGKNMQFSLYRALYRGEVLRGITGSSKAEIFRQTMQRMATRFDLDAAVLTDLFLDREQMMPTTLGYGIGVPHTRDFFLNTHYDVIEVVFLQQPIDYGALDGEAVHTLFFLFACEDRRHLNLLAKLAHLNAHENSRTFFRTKPTKERLLEFVKQWESSLNI